MQYCGKKYFTTLSAVYTDKNRPVGCHLSFTFLVLKCDKYLVISKQIYAIQSLQTTGAVGRVSGPATTNGVWPTVASATGLMTVGITQMKLSVAVSHSHLISCSIRPASEGRIQPH